VISELGEELEDEDIMEMANAGLLPWAVVDEHKPTLWVAVFTQLAVRRELAIHEGGQAITQLFRKYG
jgi:membrane-bound lytic murein transglycosylase MltF